MIVLRLAGLSLLLCLALTAPAYAYVDPGTGTIIVQAILGSIVVVSLFFRQAISRAAAFFGLKKKAPPKP